MKIIEFKLKADYIELIKLLKLLNLANSGSHAKWLVEDGEVKRNGKTELRKRAKLRTGDTIEMSNCLVKILHD